MSKKLRTIFAESFGLVNYFQQRNQGSFRCSGAETLKCPLYVQMMILVTAPDVVTPDKLVNWNVVFSVIAFAPMVFCRPPAPVVKRFRDPGL
jgi:hypothetical protein